MKILELSESRKKILNDLENNLSEIIIGQDHVIPRVTSVLKRGELGLTKPARPRGSFLFLGPTGVGKTELTLAFTGVLFGPSAIHRFDMSEYQTKQSLGRLIGERSDDSGQLGRIAEEARYGTILFDEIEKAHPEILDIFLQILDAARVTLATGETLNLENFYIVLTSNIGSAQVMDLQHSSFSTMERHVLMTAQGQLRPEIFGRVTERIVFKKLSYQIQQEIAELFIRKELDFLSQRGHKVIQDESVLPLVVKIGFDAKLGARPLRDTVERLIGNAVAKQLLIGQKVQGTLKRHKETDRLVIIDK